MLVLLRFNQGQAIISALPLPLGHWGANWELVSQGHHDILIVTLGSLLPLEHYVSVELVHLLINLGILF